MPTQYSTVIRLRMLSEDYAAVKTKAAVYRQPLSAFARNAICGIPMVCHLDEDTVKTLIRMGGVLLSTARIATRRAGLTPRTINFWISRTGFWGSPAGLRNRY